MDDWVIINSDEFIFLDHNYTECCKNIIDKDNVYFIYPYSIFIDELISDNTLKDVFNQCKIDYKRSNVYINNKKETFNNFLRYIKSRFKFNSIKKSLIFISQSIYGKIVSEIGLAIYPNYIGELDSCEQHGIYFYINDNDIFRAEKVLRIFNIDKNGNCNTIKKLKITLYCNIIFDEYINIEISKI